MSAATSEAIDLNRPPAEIAAEILRSSAYALTIFEPEAYSALQFIEQRGRPYLRCLATDRARPAKPEEIVRQLFLHVLISDYGYPRDRISVEKPVQFGSAVHEKAADIVIADKDDHLASYIIVEVKKPRRTDGIDQLKSYCNAEGSPIGVWTNGGEIAVLHREEPNLFRSLSNFPAASQTLSELLAERWTIEDLTAENKLVKERTTLKELILDMENLVLANAGVDAFEEVFKLIYAKLYDEWRASQGGRTYYLQFRVGGATPTEFYERIDGLFRDAMGKWPGVFVKGERIDLTPAHLVTCGSLLQDVKLFNSNLQVIDEAFEYLSTKVGKGEKGQYFTPRHVIDMCVKMMNPSLDEFVIDTAAGSCGFTVHTIFKVWGEQFSATGPERWQSDYASERIYGIDFDVRATKIAKALNLIAGDGKTNVYRANSLDPRSWSDDVRVGLRDRLSRFPRDPERERWNREHYRYFDFDLLLTNPPFAGEIRDGRILHQFEIAQKRSGEWQSRLGRDVLFIERNLEFLRPGGRMAIVLPQGRLNNSSDAAVRAFIQDRARVLAVVGLDQNTFKPHTGTKTSVLFLQKWNDDPERGPLCPRTDDYRIFFAASQESGKDTSGDYVYRVGADGEPVLDDHGHRKVEHDLDEIADAFVDFAARENLSFSPHDS
jgi:type I restriction enzyme M protein